MFFSKLNTFLYFVQLTLSQNVCVFVQNIETENFVQFKLLKFAFSGGRGAKIKKGSNIFLYTLSIGNVNECRLHLKSYGPLMVLRRRLMTSVLIFYLTK